jgi:hypothetical protein
MELSPRGKEGLDHIRKVHICALLFFDHAALCIAKVLDFGLRLQKPHLKPSMLERYIGYVEDYCNDPCISIRVCGNKENQMYF